MSPRKPPRPSAKASDGKARLRAERDRLLVAFLPHVAFEGWTRRALDSACKDLALPKADAVRLFPGGMTEVADRFAAWADRLMLNALEPHDVMALKVRERVHLAIRLRLEALEPWREAVRRLLSFLSLPGNGALSMRLAWRTADTVWYAAGDTATDFNHYTKRALLLAVYGTTLLYWLGDSSAGRVDTWGFLERRIGDVFRIPRMGAKAKEAAGQFARPFEKLARRARGGLSGLR